MWVSLSIEETSTTQLKIDLIWSQNSMQTSIKYLYALVVKSTTNNITITKNNQIMFLNIFWKFCKKVFLFSKPAGLICPL